VPTEPAAAFDGRVVIQGRLYLCRLETAGGGAIAPHRVPMYDPGSCALRVSARTDIVIEGA
jgi:hypothetical protein